jgi:hypothetical protein
MLLLLNLQSVSWRRSPGLFEVREAYLRHVTYMCYMYYLTQYQGSPTLWLLCG